MFTNLSPRKSRRSARIPQVGNIVMPRDLNSRLSELENSDWSFGARAERLAVVKMSKRIYAPSAKTRPGYATLSGLHWAARKAASRDVTLTSERYCVRHQYLTWAAIMQDQGALCSCLCRSHAITTRKLVAVKYVSVVYWWAYWQAIKVPFSRVLIRPFPFLVGHLQCCLNQL